MKVLYKLTSINVAHFQMEKKKFHPKDTRRRLNHEVNAVVEEQMALTAFQEW